MKKLFASLFVAALTLSGVVGCGGSPTTKPADPVKPEEKKVVEKKVEEKKIEEKKVEEKK